MGKREGTSFLFLIIACILPLVEIILEGTTVVVFELIGISF